MSAAGREEGKPAGKAALVVGTNETARAELDA